MMEAQMKKGVLDMCALYLLRDAPLYGYELMKSVRRVFPDVYEGTIYTLLRRLNAAGFTEMTERASPSGPPRKYYGITREGQGYLQELLVQWHALTRGVHALGIDENV